MPFERQGPNTYDRVVDSKRNIFVKWLERDSEGRIDFELSIENQNFIVLVQEKLDIEHVRFIWVVYEIRFPQDFAGDPRVVQSIALEGVQEFVRLTESTSKWEFEILSSIE